MTAMQMDGMTMQLLWLTLLGQFTAGNEVFLKAIQIYKTHDRFVKPTVYFFCEGDAMGKVYLKDVVATNITYQYADEDIALSHVDPGQCRPKCGIKDEDTFSKDDLFGETFAVCDNDFDKSSHTHQVKIDGEVELTMRCPDCNHQVPPPKSPPVEPSSADGTTSAHKRKQGVLVAIMAVAVLSGVLFGLFAAKLCRAWWDDEAEDARRRFHALYADPAADIEDLPELPTTRRFDGVGWLARRLRRAWLRVRKRDTYRSMQEFPGG